MPLRHDFGGGALALGIISPEALAIGGGDYPSLANINIASITEGLNKFIGVNLRLIYYFSSPHRVNAAGDTDKGISKAGGPMAERPTF